MNSDSPNTPENRLLDELIHEQHQPTDETFLKQIEAAIDAGAPAVSKRSPSRLPARIAIAAAVTLTAGGFWWHRQEQHDMRYITDASMSEKQQLLSKEIVSGGMRESDLPASPHAKKPRVFTDATPATPSLPGDEKMHDLAANAWLFTARESKDANSAEGKTEIASNANTAPSAQTTITPPANSPVDASPPPASVNGLLASRSGDTLKKLPQERDDATREYEANHRIGRVAGLALPSEELLEHTSGDRYGSFIDQPWKTSASEQVSTFSIDVDTASYGNVRRMIREGRAIPRDAVRIEECINAFSYRYDPPKGDSAFAVGASLAACPWEPKHQLVRIAIKGREIDAAKRPASNLVFLIDVSGSMQSPDKLPLLKQSMATLVEQLDERDRVAIVVYAGSEGVALESTRLDAEGRAKVLQTLSKLGAGGSTNGGAGIKRAYEMAMKQKIDGGVNRVILATDGDFNVGVTGQSSLVELVKERAKNNVYLTVLGYGTGNLNDSMMDAITRDGNGNYFYIDSEREGRKVFLQNLTGTLVTIAKDLKIQVEFNPAKVGSYRLIGYANRVLRNEDFKNDKVDAGDIGAGHTVTAFYELTPPGSAVAADGLKYQPAPPKPSESNEWLTVKLRHKHPEGDTSSLTEFPLTGDATALDKTDTDFQFATAVALFGMKLRGMEEVGSVSWQSVMELANSGLKDDANEDRAEFVGLLKKLGGQSDSVAPPPAEVAPGNRR